ncbi:MAG: glycosyltransferase family 2 protein [Planctomycetota bacterium]
MLDLNPEKLRLSVVVVAYNEEPVICNNLRRVISELIVHPEMDWELVCVNDGSTDRTGKIMDEVAVGNPRVQVLHHRRNFGQGRALRTAFNVCRGDVVVTLDADMSYGPEYIFALVQALREHNVEIALASPYMKGGEVRNVPFYRRILSRWGNMYLARMSQYPVSTSTCVVRAYRCEVLDNIILTSDGMELQLEILMKSFLMGFRVCEVPARLAWADEKAAAAGFRRISKMRIWRSIRLYLLLGWLSRPAYVFMVFSMLLLFPGMYMAVALLVRVIVTVWGRINQGVFAAISGGLQDVYANYTYSVVFCGTFLLVGMQVFAFSLLLLQNKFYFEETCRLAQSRMGGHVGKSSDLTLKARRIGGDSETHEQG